MMSLDLMLQIVSGINSKWQHPLADELCSLWGMDNAVYIRASSNVIFRCQKGEARYYLRFNQGKEKQWNNEIEILLYLYRNDYPCVKPVRSLSGKFVESYNGYSVAMFEALKGQQKETENLTLDDFHAWGKALGQLHKLTATYPMAHLIKPWNEAISEFDKYLLKPEMIDEMDALIQWANSLPHGKSYGVIHADFEQDNLFWTDLEIPSSLDYDDCIQMWYAADIAFALRDLYKEDNVMERLQAFRMGYESTSQLAIDMFEMIPKFLRLHDFMQYIRIKKAMDIHLYAEKPEWMINLEKVLVNEYLKKIEQHNLYKHY